jgi:hypothetical protein
MSSSSGSPLCFRTRILKVKSLTDEEVDLQNPIFGMREKFLSHRNLSEDDVRYIA